MANNPRSGRDPGNYGNIMINKQLSITWHRNSTRLSCAEQETEKHINNFFYHFSIPRWCRYSLILIQGSQGIVYLAVNAMVADDLATQVARSSAPMAMTLLLPEYSCVKTVVSDSMCWGNIINISAFSTISRHLRWCRCGLAKSKITVKW